MASKVLTCFQDYFNLLDEKCSYFKSAQIGWFAHIYSDDQEPGYGIYGTNGALKFSFGPKTSCWVILKLYAWLYHYFSSNVEMSETKMYFVLCISREFAVYPNGVSEKYEHGGSCESTAWFGLRPFPFLFTVTENDNDGRSIIFQGSKCHLTPDSNISLRSTPKSPYIRFSLCEI